MLTQSKKVGGMGFRDLKSFNLVMINKGGDYYKIRSHLCTNA